MEPHDLKALLHQLSQVKMASPAGASTGTPAFASTPFTKLASFNHGGVFLGRFIGQTPWERHRQGDELVQVLDGEVDLTVMTARRPVHVTLRTGGIFVVPSGLWHRQHARTEVTLLSATPTPTDMSFADDPRANTPLKPPGGKRARPRPSGPAAGRSAAR
jgi:mannose-6-phosphate isomerase-like protein (cupin superfamily)